MADAVPRLADGRCELSSDPSRPVCDCGSLTSELRHLFGVPVDLNRVGLTDLLRLPGIGEVRAAQILEARAEGSFESVASLQQLRGIGSATVARLEPRLFVGLDPLCEKRGEGEKKIGDSQDPMWRSTQ